MNVITGAAIPLVLLAAWAVGRAAVGRPLKRYALNGIVGLAVLIYFLITAGLGIFWVANQELPVFDLHYLFGYLTLILVGVHVAINARTLLTFFRKSAPRRMLSPDRRRWRPTLAWTGRLVGLAVYGYACYWLGMGQAATTITVVEGDEIERPATLSAPLSSVQAPQQQTTAGVEAPPALQEPHAVRRQLVEENGVQKDLAVYYHDRTKHTRTSVRSGRRLDWSSRPHPFKVFPGGGPLVSLPKPFVPVTTPTGTAIEARRPNLTALDPSPVSLAQLSTLLHLTNGITKVVNYPQIRYYKRAAPSAGALYPALTYVLARTVEGLEPGLYHYDVMKHALRLVRDSDLAEEVARVTASPHLVRGSSFVLFHTAEYFRTSWKYHERGWRYCLLDVGHVALSAMVAGAAMGLDSAPIGRFDDAVLNSLLDLDSTREGTFLVVPYGRRADRDDRRAEPAFVAKATDLANPKVEALVTLAHGRTYLAHTGGRVRPFGVPEPVRHDAGGSLLRLPTPELAGDPLDAVIERRRSERNWSEDPLSIHQLSSVLHHTFGFTDGHADPSIEHQGALRLYVAILNVSDVPAGVYRYVRKDHALALIKSGDMRGTLYQQTLFQEVVRDSGAVLIKTIDAKAMEYPDGARGYRYATMEAGMVGGLLYLQSVALGLGVTGIGAFFDDEVSELIGVPASQEHIIYVSVFGVPE